MRFGQKVVSACCGSNPRNNWTGQTIELKEGFDAWLSCQAGSKLSDSFGREGRVLSRLFSAVDNSSENVPWCGNKLLSLVKKKRWLSGFIRGGNIEGTVRLMGKSVRCPIMQVFGKFKANLKYDFLVRYVFFFFFTKYSLNCHRERVLFENVNLIATL